MVSAVANGYENTVSLILFIDPVSLVVQHLHRKRNPKEPVWISVISVEYFSEGSLIEGGITLI